MNKVQFRFNIILFFIITVLFFISISAFDPFISSYAEDLGISPAVIGSVMGVTGLASMFFRFPLGVFSDMLNKRRLIIQVGLLITIIGWIIAFIEPNATTLYLAKFLDGITGATWVLYTVMFASYFGIHNSAKAVAFLTLADYIGALVGSIVGGIVANSYGYSYSFLVAVFAASIAFVLTFFLKEKKVTVKRETYDLKKIVKEQITDKNLWLLSLLAIIALMASFGMRVTFTPLVARDLGGDAIALSWLSNTFLIAGGIAAALCGGFFYKKLGLVNTAVVGAFLQCVVAILTPFAPNLLLLFCLQAFSGIAFALNFTVLMSLSIMNIPEHKQSTRMGFFQSVFSFGMFFGPVLMGILTVAFSRSFSFVIIGILSAISGILIKFFIRTKTIEKQKILTKTDQIS
ncbi:MFS transporter [Peribacillus muralis]|uniref:MFS transporter n=1 Tax=Peribacillus muralis TaxID=264697 RepID=UPI00070C879D|nr:MFS transporter [Peribacillus muralis]